jgi:hypothetical protein
MVLKRAIAPCKCVLRAIFRICYARFDRCVKQDRHLSSVRFSQSRGTKRRHGTWGRPDEEFMADFCLLARGGLSEDEHRLFRFHFLLGADWKICCVKLGMKRGDFFHAVYRVEAKLGRRFAEVLPHALFPIDEYYASQIGRLTGSNRESADFAPSAQGGKGGQAEARTVGAAV